MFVLKALRRPALRKAGRLLFAPYFLDFCDPRTLSFTLIHPSGAYEMLLEYRTGGGEENGVFKGVE